MVEFVEWGGSHVDSVSAYATYKMIRGTDSNWGVLVATIYDTDHRRTIKYCPYDGYRDDANKWKKWQRVVTTTVEDVPETTITWESTSIFSGEIASYEVRNGICYVYFRGNPIIQSEHVNGAIVATGLPKPTTNGFYMTGAWNLTTSILFQVSITGNLLVWSDATNNGKSMHFSFSYPVAES